jgi:hypothetical protein
MGDNFTSSSGVLFIMASSAILFKYAQIKILKNASLINSKINLKDRGAFQIFFINFTAE